MIKSPKILKFLTTTNSPWLNLTIILVFLLCNTWTTQTVWANDLTTDLPETMNQLPNDNGNMSTHQTSGDYPVTPSKAHTNITQTQN
uniref:F-ORF n=1 Tax=Postolata guangxiensis TaxID=2964736 RepID=UPI0024113F08|nr:F-ORF [Postolata guangxiensis]WEL36022.1 F-ORF [Postolata guangxiensis]